MAQPPDEQWYRARLAEHATWIRVESPSVRAVARRADCSRHRARELVTRAQLGEDLPQQVDDVSKPDGTRQVGGKGGRIRTLQQLLVAADVDPDRWSVRDWKANAWEQHSAQRGHVTLHQVKATLERRVLPLRPAQTRPMRPLEVRPPVNRRGKLWIFVPDSQHGIRWLDDRYRRAITLQDPAAVDAIVQLVAYLQPDGVGYLGDMVDAAEASTKFGRAPAYRGTLQAGIDLWRYDLCRLVAAAPHAEHLWKEGNHDDRVLRAIRERLPDIDGLRQPGGHPIGSMPQLLGLDDLGVRYSGPYSDHAGTYIGGPDLRTVIDVRHGDTVRPDGITAAQAVLARTQHHRVRGHDHRRYIASKTIWEVVDGVKRGREVHVMSPGCLCRLGGVVPGVKAEEDWQQGVGLAWIDDDAVTFEAIPIQHGRIRYGGRVYYGDPSCTAAAEATGWEQIAQEHAA